MPSVSSSCVPRFRFLAWVRRVATQGFSATVVIVLGSQLSVGASPRVPQQDSEVVATLRSGSRSAAERELAGLRSRLGSDPQNLALALDVARRCLERGREEADPRFLGQAQVALMPWVEVADAPIEVGVLQATVHQSLHEFDLALQELGKVLQRDPRNVQAWLTQATVLGVRGDFAQARRAVAHLLGQADDLTVTTAIAQLASVTGQASAACLQLEAALTRAGSPERETLKNGVAQQLWARTVFAETLARLGRAEEADREFRMALNLAPRDPYLLGVYADFLLDHQRAAEAERLVSQSTRIDGLLLRLIEAQAALGDDPGKEKGLQLLAERFDLARARGDRLHRREEARFELRVRNRPVEALALARENWTIQKEPADARLLWEAARAAGDAASEAEVLNWVRETRLEDVIYAAAPTSVRTSAPF